MTTPKPTATLTATLSDLFLWLPELAVMVVSFALAGLFGTWWLSLPGFAATAWILTNRVIVARQNTRALREHDRRALPAATTPDTAPEHTNSPEVAR